MVAPLLPTPALGVYIEVPPRFVIEVFLSAFFHDVLSPGPPDQFNDQRGFYPMIDSRGFALPLFLIYGPTCSQLIRLVGVFGMSTA